ncbi:hypothetical protein AN963_27525 [Brevibacillus choshinensis]|uniref:Uncharacterized protein n=1 Tax=Brevibacillus choshinensis TaxID=54911 RepID=A0ABR5N3I8_BRECH|nr:hypothetical protein AN963_27525 [Brevibacillus choshinensis]
MTKQIKTGVKQKAKQKCSEQFYKKEDGPAHRKCLLSQKWCRWATILFTLKRRFLAWMAVHQPISLTIGTVNPLS